MTHLNPLSELVSIIGGGTPNRSRKDYYNGPIPWVTPKDMKQWNIYQSLETITKTGLDQSASRLVPVGSILIVIRSGVLKHTLPIAIARRPVAINQDMKALIPKAGVDPEYVARFIQTSSPRILQSVRATTADNFPLDELKELQVPLPSLSIQRETARLLSTSDRTRRLCHYALQMCDEIVPAAFLQFFDDPRTNPRGWEETIVDEVLEWSQYGTSQKFSSSPPGYPILGMANITEDGRVSLSPRNFVDLSPETFEELKLRSGDVIFNRTNSTDLVGKTACWRLKRDAVLASYLVRLRLKSNVLPEFFVALLNTRYFKSLFQERCKKAVGQSNISPTLLREFRLYVPPITLQVKFAAFVDQHERYRAVHLEAFRQADHLFQTLLHQAFATPQ